MKIEICANNVEDLGAEIENLKHDWKVKSINYKFNTIEYYKNNPFYCQATVELQ